MICQHFDDELRLRQNHRKNQEVGLLYGLYSVAPYPRTLFTLTGVKFTKVHMLHNAITKPNPA